MNILAPENIRLDAAASTKAEALQLIADLAVARGYSEDAAGVLEGLREREAQLSTALMDGVAIPHAKHTAVTSPALLIIRLANGVDWTDDDVNVLVAMLVPEAESGTTHLQLLAQVSRALIDDDVRKTLSSGTAEAIYEALDSRIRLD